MRQEVPERYVTPTSTTTVSEEVAGMAEEVLSSTRLMVIIDDLHLYANERKTQAPEEIVEKMRKKIDIKPLMASDLAPNRKDFSAFKIAFSAQDPQIAQDVTSRLTSPIHSREPKEPAGPGDQYGRLFKFNSIP